MSDFTNQGTCEFYLDPRGAIPGTPQCGRPAVLRYPAMGGGYMRLCAEHGEKHRDYCGAWDGSRWSLSKWETPKASR